MAHHSARYWIIRAHLLGASSGLLVGLVILGFRLGCLELLALLAWTSCSGVVILGIGFVILPGVAFGLAIGQLFAGCGRRDWRGYPLAIGTTTALLAFGVAFFVSLLVIPMAYESMGMGGCIILLIPGMAGLVSGLVLFSGFATWGGIGGIPRAVTGWMLAAGLLGGFGFGLVLIGLLALNQTWLFLFLYLPGHMLTAGPLGWLRWKMTEPGGRGLE